MTDPLMTRVRNYVETCQRYGWRPAFTEEQFLAIQECGRRGLVDVYPGPLGLAPGNPHYVQVYWMDGFEVGVDDTPRQQMPTDEAELYSATFLFHRYRYPSVKKN